MSADVGEEQSAKRVVNCGLMPPASASSHSRSQARERFMRDSIKWLQTCNAIYVSSKIPARTTPKSGGDLGDAIAYALLEKRTKDTS